MIVEGLDADPLTDDARAAAEALHGDLPPGPLAYAHWRIPTLPELFAAKPKRGLEPGGYERGWRMPTRGEVRERVREVRRWAKARG